MIEFRIEGLQELERQLLEFGPKVAKNGLRAANYAGALTMRDAVKATAPVRTGVLKANVTAFRRRAEDNVAKHSVGVKGVRLKYGNTALNRRLKRAGRKYQADGPAFYAKFLEYGTSKMDAQPFMRPAFENTAQESIDAVRNRLAVAIERAAKA